jgi:hypothetical protein
MILFIVGFLQYAAGFGDTYSIGSDNESGVWDGRERVGEAGGVYVYGFLSCSLEHVVKGPELFFGEVLRFGGWYDFEI